MPSAYPPESPSSDLVSLLRKGLGRAVLQIQERYDPDRDMPLICYFATHHAVYDPQCESYRGEYLADMIEATGQAELYVAYLCEAMQRPAPDACLGQICQVALWLIRRGHSTLREALYSVFARGVARGDLTGAEEIVLLDGAAGLRFVARRLLNASLEEEDNWQAHSLLDALEQKLGAEAATVTLDRLCRGRSPVATYLRQLRANARQCRQKAQTSSATLKNAPVPSYEAIRNSILQNQSARYLSWGHRMDKETARQLAKDLRQEQDVDRLKRLLMLFSHRRLPGDFSRLFVLTQDQDALLARRAVRALAHIAHSTVREYGLERIANGDPGTGVRLLVRNPGPEDAALLNALARRDDEEGRYHDLAGGLLDYAEQNENPETLPALIALYERVPCSLCRASAVEHLLDRNLLTGEGRLPGEGCLPVWMRAECRYDCADSIRAAVAYGRDRS